jgi:hypothetical protein
MFNANNIDNFWQGLGYFGIGAAAGALGAGVGSGVSSVLAGGGFGAGFVGSSTAMVAVPSFASGAAIGGIAGTTSSFTLGMGNGLMQGQSIGEAYLSSFKMSLIGGGVGALLGGLAGGWQAWGQNRNFWTGELSSAVTWEDKMRLTYQRGLDNGGGGYDETTLGKNLLGTDYNGPNNVKGCVMQRTDVPIDYFGPTPNGTFVDYPALAHDIAYYRMGYEKGGIHLFFNPLTKAADARFVVQQLYLGTKNLWISPVLSLKSYALGIGLSAAATSTIWVPYTTYKIGRNNQWW